MKKRKSIITVLFAIGILLLLLFVAKMFGPYFGSRSSLLTSILSNQIVFYGKVVDENDNPVPFAEVKYSELNNSNFDKVWTGGVKYGYLKADANGCFSISGEGGSLYVACSHSDYYLTETSGNKFNYGMNAGKDPAVDPTNPAIFRLRKKGVCEPLIFRSGYDASRSLKNIKKVPRDTTVYLDLKSGLIIEFASENTIEIYQTNNLVNEKDENFDWEYILRIRGGGFCEKDMSIPFNFIAPPNGYVEELRIGAKSGDMNWEWNVTKHYFVRFQNNTYGVLDINFCVNNIRFRSLLNPKIGSRNLEYNREIQLNKTQRGDSYRPLK